MATTTTFDLYQGNREVLRDFFEPTASEGIVQGMMVYRDNTTGKLKKAVGGAAEFAMVAENDQTTGACDNGERISCIIGPCEFLTSYFVADVYTLNQRLEVSPVGGAEGKLRAYSSGVPPIVGRYWGTVVRDGATLMRVLLSRQ